MQVIKFQQSREFTEVLNTTFSFFGQNFKQLMKIVLFTVCPIGVLVSVAISYSQSSIWMSEFSGQQAAPDASFWIGYFFSLIMSLCLPALNASAVYEYISQYGKTQGPVDMTFGQSWLFATKYFGKMLLANISLGILSFLGFMACIIPGLYVLGAFSLTLPVLANENRGVFDAMSRSKELVTNYWWQTFGVIFLLGLILVSFVLVLVVPFGLFTGAMTMHATEDSFNFQVIYISFILLTTVASYFISSIPMIGMAVQYHNLIEKKEAVGLAGEIDRIGGEGETS